MAKLGMSDVRELEDDSLTRKVGVDGVTCKAVGCGWWTGNTNISDKFYEKGHILSSFPEILERLFQELLNIFSTSLIHYGEGTKPTDSS